jgi:hypothetical protein
MKKLTKITIGSLVLLFCLSTFTFGQDMLAIASTPSGSSLRMDRQLTLVGDSKKQEIKVDMNEEFNCVWFTISSSVTGGELTIEIIDPSGTRVGKFSVGCQTDYKDKVSKVNKPLETADGTLQKKYNDVKKGNWIVRAVPEKARGTIKIKSYQFNKKGL